MNKELTTCGNRLLSNIQITIKIRTRRLQTSLPKASYNFETPSYIQTPRLLMEIFYWLINKNINRL